MHLYRTITYVTVLFLFCFLASWAQQPFGITTSVGNSVAITICDGDTVTFTLEQSSSPAFDYEFIRIRNGITTIIEHNQALTNAFTLPGTYNGTYWEIEDGDIYYGEINEYDPPPSSTIQTDQITVNVLPLSGGSSLDGGTIQQQDQFVCVSNPGITLTISSTTSGTSYFYQWEKSLDGGTIFTDITSATSEFYVTGLITETTLFRRRVQSNLSSGTCIKYSTVYASIVSDLDPGSLDLSLNQSICYNTSSGILGVTGIPATVFEGILLYQWEESTDGGLNWNDIASATQQIYTPPPLTTTTSFRRKAINTSQGRQCEALTNSITIIVEEELLAGVLSGSSEICLNNTPTSLVLSGASSQVAVGYQWQTSSDGVTFIDIAGVNSMTLDFNLIPSLTPSNTTYYRVRVETVSPTACEVLSNVASITVYPEMITFTSSAPNGVYCTGEIVTLYASSLNPIQFEYKIDGNILARTTATSFSLPPITGTHTVTLVALSNVLNCREEIDILLVENEVEGGTIEGDQYICFSGRGLQPNPINSVNSATVNQGTDIALVSSATYQWESTVDNGINWIPISGANQPDYQPSGLYVTTSYRRRADNTINGVLCSAYSNLVTLEVIPDFDAGTPTVPIQAVCEGESPPTLTVTNSTIHPDAAYQWEVSTDNGVSWTNIIGATQLSYTPSTIMSTTLYRLQIFSSVASATCYAFSPPHTVNVIALESGSLDVNQGGTVMYNTSPGSIGNGTLGNSASTNLGTISYYWEESTDNGNNWSPITNSNSQNYSPPPLVQDTRFRRVASVTYNGIICSEISNAIEFEVSDPVPGRVEEDQEICEGSLPNDLALVGASHGMNISYQWEISSDGSNYIPISNTTTQLTFTSTTTWNPSTPVTYYRVQLTESLSGSTFVSASTSITIYDFNLSLTSNANASTFCSGDMVSFSASGGQSYEFYVNGVLFQARSAVSTFATSLVSNTTVEVVGYSGLCSKTVEVNLVANNVEAGIIEGPIEVCFGSSVSLTSSVTGSIQGNPAGFGSYQWQQSRDATNWSDILGAQSSALSISSLIENTYFRRNTLNTLNSLPCSISSNEVYVQVTPFILEQPGTSLDQTQCDGQIIEPIQFSHGGGATGITVVGLPNGITPTITGNSIIISGVLNVNNTQTQTFPFTVTAASPLCSAGDSISGSITVIARPQIEMSYIQANDVTDVSCSGGFEGAIRIPELSPAFDQRIIGVLNHEQQQDEIRLVNAPDLSDVYTIEIDGIGYEHTVIPTYFLGPIQNVNEVASALVDEINNASGNRLASVVASLQNSTTLLLSAKEPGVAFSVNSAVVSSSSSSATLQHSSLVANFTSQYNFSWTGPNGFGSTDLSIENLEAGDYTLSVQVDNCSIASATFTIEEPDPILVSTDMCNEVLQVEVSGGVAPYTIELFDSNSVLIETVTTNNTRIFPNLTPGSNYRIEVFDSVCDLAVQQAIQLPFELNLNQSGVTVVDDYCNDSEGSGFIELGGNAGGEAFSGGSGQFSYRWTGSGFTASSRDIYNLEPGLYTVTVTDEVLGCTDQAVFEVGSVDPLVINLDPSINLDATGAIALACEGDDDGAIEISVNGGLGNYSYSWTRNGNVIAGATELRIEDLGIGRYEVTVTDTPPSGIAPNLPNCQASRVFEVKSPQPISVFVSSSTGSTTFYCPSENGTASFEVEVFGGTPPFTVELTAENGSISTHSVSSNSATTIDGLRPEIEGETYQVKVIDSNNCESQTASTTLNFQSVEAVTLRPQVTQIDCSRGVLGSITLDLVNGQISNPELVQIQWRSANANIYDTWANSNGVLENIETGGTYQVVVTQGTCELFRADDIQVTDVVEQMLFINNIDVQSGGCNGDLGRIELDLRGGFPPVQIEWEQYRVVNSTTGATSTTTGSTTSRLEWVTLPQYQNNAIATDLEVGTYRAHISDGANTVEGIGCGGLQTTNPIAIGATAFELANFRIENGTVCDTASATASIYFTVLNTLPNTNNNEFTPKIMLDAKELGSDLISLGNDNYRIVNIASGNHTLNITTGTSTAVLGSYANCSINHPFEIQAPLPIRYGGATQFDLDACAAFTQISVDPTLVTGGAPYQIDGNILYDYSWSYTPFSDGDPTLIPQTYVGDTIFDASPGTYELTISDSANCSSEPIVFVLNASDSTEPFSIEGILQEVSSEDSNTTIEQVKVLPPNCMSTRSNGQIGIEISGGLRPYTIEWYKEEIQSETVTASSSVELVRLEEATNSTHLQNLEPGKYQLVIHSQNQECSQDTQINSNNYYEEFFVVPNNEELYIIDGPNIGDVNLCRLSPGIISIQVFDNSNGELSFYYNNGLVNLSEDQPTESNTYNLLIENPVPYAELLISNENGCSVSTLVEIAEIAPPEFDYTSPSIRASGSILAREEILFENNSPLPYSYSIWHFGDGSSERVSSNTLSPTTHAYGISGTYYATLRNYNNLGCYQEVTKEIVVGNGYNVMAPNAFSPNGDGINDFYRPLFSGFARAVLRIYDDRGNILYTEEVEESNSTEITGIKLEGWNGENAPLAPYYIYHFTGYLITDENEITRTGTFVIIK